MEDFQVENVLVQLPRIGYSRIEWLEKALNGGVRTNFTRYSASDINWLAKMFRSLLWQPGPERFVTFERYFEDDDIESYVGKDGQHLPGLFVGDDGGHMPVWRPAGPDEYSISTAERRNYLRHGLMLELAQVLVEVIAELTPEKAEGMRMNSVLAATNLALALVELDEQNEDSSLPFEQRLDPHKEIFGDISRDIPGKRLHDILQAQGAEYAQMQGRAIQVARGGK